MLASICQRLAAVSVAVWAAAWVRLASLRAAVTFSREGPWEGGRGDASAKAAAAAPRHDVSNLAGALRGSSRTAALASKTRR